MSGSPADRPRITVLDYGMGNRRSVQKALEHVGAEAPISRDPEMLEAAQGVVIPGVGAFPRAMANLDALGLIEPVRHAAHSGVPVLGICLGMQLLFESSQEIEPTAGLGLLPGEVRWLAAEGLRLPHIGWNEVSFTRSSALLSGLPVAGCAFYHVHSLVPHPTDGSLVVGRTEYGERFATIVEQGSVAGVQFHPEKSSAHGLRLLANFVARCAARTRPQTGLAAPA